MLTRARANSQAQLGKYEGSTDKTANESLFQASYSYWLKEDKWYILQ